MIDGVEALINVEQKLELGSSIQVALGSNIDILN